MRAFAIALTFAAGLALAGIATAPPAQAGPQPDEILDDPELEQRARALSANLRCLVCQNQSIDDSDAPLARDLRVLVRERLVEGYSDDEIEAFVVARYGDFVLFRPPFNVNTVLLWGSPILVFGAGALGLFLALRRRRDVAPSVTADLTPQERAELERILGEKSSGNS
ncbi:MAG: cytochrome c-type biogenesis protein CcmH [Salinarimonas sp.]|nr:cytochrome c-type biogenesis protein CcmH [Salinarimonas sp.]